ncbi:hypothetical protein ALO35_200014 [Pseudomonas amygdali pv. lachrymans]|uniref:Uncharacterized protein n=1 Tax=Pseudomonas amygdali pv. lachrymans TaxID=53707 RepID=A0A0P9SG26_PSEAV|nr:hypothetical protein ALO35_200014 [Pseudomonas amygdali pv. lachrymans]
MKVLLISCWPRISLRDDCDSDVDGIVEIDRRLFSFDETTRLYLAGSLNRFFFDEGLPPARCWVNSDHA